jgi:DNA-binding transcriptional MerR regulator
VSGTLSIGDFSRVTHLTVKTLRHYHDLGLLVPADINAETGYRYYTVEQVPAAQVIRRFRDLDMPLAEVKAVLEAPDLDARNALIGAHLARLEHELAVTREAVASLKDLVGRPETVEIAIEHRSAPAQPALAIRQSVSGDDLSVWWRGALGELGATARAQGVQGFGPLSGLYAGELFQQGSGEATIYLPVPDPRAIRPVGRVEELVVPAAELAVVVHRGSHSNVDFSYGALGTYVARHMIGVDAPVRENYLIGPNETDDESAWVTEIAWPVFRTA